MNHPLTDEVFGEIRPTVNEPGDGVIAYMRAAADWQLEECIEELNALLYILEISGKIKEAESLEILNVFKRNMRPQENN